MRPGSLLVPYPPRLQLAAQGLEVPRPFRPVGLRYGEAVDLFFSRGPDEGVEEGVGVPGEQGGVATRLPDGVRRELDRPTPGACGEPRFPCWPRLRFDLQEHRTTARVGAVAAPKIDGRVPVGETPHPTV